MQSLISYGSYRKTSQKIKNKAYNQCFYYIYNTRKLCNFLMDSENSRFFHSLKRLEQSYSQRLLSKRILDGIGKKNMLQLLRIVKLEKLGFFQSDKDILSLTKCFETLKVLSSSFEPEKYCHYEATIQYLIAKYQGTTNRKIKLNERLKLQIVSKLEKQPYIVQLQRVEITSRQLQFLNSQKVNLILRHIMDNDLTLQNPQCVCCIRNFVKNLPVVCKNAQYSSIIGLTSKRKTEKIVLQRYINSLCNQKGGVILIGAEVINNIIYATGIKFKDEQQIKAKETELRELMESIQPQNYFQINRVFVHSCYTELENVAEQHMRICFRFLIMPLRINRLSFLELAAKGYKSQFEFYTLSEQKQPIKTNFNIQLYGQMHHHFSYTQLKANFHYGICCTTPLQTYSTAYRQLEDKGLLKNSDKPELIQPLSYKDEPNFLYPNTSLLAVNSKKQILKFITILYNLKITFQLSQPFKNSFKNCSRSIMMISHMISRSKIRQIIQKYYKQQQKTSSERMNIMPVYKTLQIDRLKLSKYNQNILGRRFEQRYLKRYDQTSKVVMDGKSKLKQIVYLHFNDYGESIYAYLICEQLNIRPIFVKEKYMNKAVTSILAIKPIK